MQQNKVWTCVILILLQFVIYNAKAQTGSKKDISFSGKVTNRTTGEPLPGATIYIPDAKSGTSTNDKGEFSIRNIPAGNYLIEVSNIGFASVTEHILLNTAFKKDFSLSPSVVENEGIVVTGVTTATKIKRAPTPVTLVSKQALLQSVSTNLIDGLSKQPGIAQLSTGPAISKPIIRGMGYNRVVVLNDGVRQEGQQWGDEHGIEIDEYSVTKVELLKGPASLMYGSDAMAGVINIITNQPVPEGTLKGNIMANYQTNNSLTGIGGNLAGNQNGLNWNIYGSFKGAQDYKNKYDGYVYNSKFNEKNFGGYIGYNGDWGYSHIIVSNFNQKTGIVEGVRDATSGSFLKPVNNNGVEDEAIVTNDDFKGIQPGIPYQHIQHFKVVSDNKFNVGSGKISVNVGYQNNRRREFGEITSPDDANLYFNLNTLTYNAQYHFAQKYNWNTTLGVTGMMQSNQNKGEEFLIPEYNLFDIGGFVYTQRNFDRFSISGGLRFDNRDIHSKSLIQDGDEKFEDFRKSFSNVSGSAGISYEISKPVTLKFNIARGFRAPSIPELASNGAHEGTFRYEYGNKDLKSETSWQLDAGMEISTDHLLLNFTPFVNFINNYIYYSKLPNSAGGDSIIIDNGQTLTAYQYTQAKATLYGAELYFDFHPHPLDWLHFENTLSLVKGRFNEAVDGSKDLPSIPAARWLLLLRGDFMEKGKLFRNLSIKAELDNTFAQNDAFTAYNTETPTPGYTLLNLGASANIIHNKKTLCSIYLALNNVTDVAYQNHLSRLKYTDVNNVTGRMGVYNMGRNFSVKVNVPLSFK